MLPKKITPEDKIINALDIIGYKGPILRKNELIAAIDGGPKSIEYTQLINFITNEIRTLCNIDEEVNAISSPEDSVSFIMELSSFLKELNCPYISLTEGHVSDRLQNTSDCLTLLDYLLTELMGARIRQESKPEKKIELKLQETPEAADMRIILQTLRFPKPPANISVEQLFQKLNPTIDLVHKKAGCKLSGEGIFKGGLSKKQWEILEGVQKDLHNEYKIRREMLLTRLDVTIQSFEWSDKTKGKEGLIEKIYSDKRKLLKVEPDVDFSDLLAARKDLAIIEKTSNSNVRKNTRTTLNKVIIGKVPDRGGRTTEIAPPPPEMPSWQQRSAGPPGGGRGGGRGGGGNFNNRGSYNSGNQRGGHQGNQGSNYGGGQANRSFDSAGSYDNKYGGSNNSGGRGGYDGNRRGGYDGNRSGGYDGNRSGGYDGNKSGGYDGNRSGGYDGNRSGGYDGNRSGGYDNNRGVGHDRNQGGSFDNNRSGGGNYSKSSYDNSGGGYERRGSGTFNEAKRPKTYDNFQSNKTTYADQYVQDNQQNQQYQPRGRGRSNYNRGGRGGHNYR